MILGLIYILLGIIPCIVFYLNYKYTYWKRKGVPHIKPHYLYGSFKGVRTKIHGNEPVRRAYNCAKSKGDFGGLYMFVKPALLPVNLDIIKSILIKDFNYFTDRGIYYNEKHDPLTGHLFALHGQKWRTLRNKLSPTFTSGKMKFMFPTIVQVGEHFKQVLDAAVTTNPDVEMKELLGRFTTDVIGTCAFGIDCNSLKDPDAEFRTKGRMIFTKPRHNMAVQTFCNAFPKLASILRIKLIPDEQSDFFMRVVRETVEYREKNNIHRNDFMDLLIGLKNESNDLTIEQIAAQAFVFFVAGFETSSTLMSFCLYELALNQNVQDKLRDEIKKTLEKHDGKFTYEAMVEMKYMEQVINETLRMYPPVPTLIRKALKDYKIPDSTFTIEKDTLVMIPVHAIQNDPDIYPKPDIFDPDRFLPEEIQKRHPCAFLPFGDGPRNCIGLRFGKMQSYVGLVTLLQNFKFLPCSKTSIPLKLDIKSPLISVEGGTYLKVEKIN